MSKQDIFSEIEVASTPRNSFNLQSPPSFGKYVFSSWPLLCLVIAANVSEYLILHTFFVDGRASFGSSSSFRIKLISVDFPEQVSPSNTLTEYTFKKENSDIQSIFTLNAHQQADHNIWGFLNIKSTVLY